MLMDIFLHMGQSNFSLSKTRVLSDAILPRKGPVTRAMSKRLQEDWARATEEGPRVLMNLRVDL